MTSAAPRTGTAARSGPRDPDCETGLPRTARTLIYLAVLLSAGHHLDHVLRGAHLAWPLTDQVSPFTISLGVYRSSRSDSTCPAPAGSAPATGCCCPDPERCS